MLNKFKKLNKSKKIVLIIILSLIILLTFLLSFAYLAPIITGSADTELIIEGSGKETLTFDEGADISLVANPDNFGIGDSNIYGQTNLVATARANKSDTDYSPSYNVYFNIGVNDYEYSDGFTPELLLTVTDPLGNIVTSLPGLTYTTQKGVSGFDITTKTGVITIAENYSITSPDYNTPVSQNWQFQVTLIAHDFAQNANQGKTLRAQIEASISEVTEYSLALSDFLLDTHGSAQGLFQHTSSLTNGAQDNNYRYSGSNDVVNKNYVCFGSDEEVCPEDNLYRIIGIYDGKVKLIKNTSIGMLAFDEYASTNNFANSSIKDYLNTDFYNSIASNYQGLISQSEWYHGGNMTENPMEGIYYDNETAYEFYREDILEASSPSILNIGLINASDYGFAAYSSAWITQLEDYNAQTTKENNWMYTGINEWTITKEPAYPSHHFQISNIGDVGHSLAEYQSNVRPTFYLNADVELISGTGSVNSPFRLKVPEIPPASDYLIENHTAAQGLLQHTPELVNSAGDNNYRYSGSNTVVSNNWVCFGSDEATCPEENKYRIIGIYDGSVKLIKNTSAGNIVWDADDSNDYETSDMKNYLNGEFYNNIPSNYQTMIKDSTWNVGGNDTWDETAYEFYRDNIASPVVNKTTNGKIGLMYASDYGFAAHTEAWTVDLIDYNSQTIKDNNWVFTGNNEWTIMPLSFYSNLVWNVYYHGYAGSSRASNGYASRPVLYLESSAKILSGAGSEADPFRIGM